MYSKNDILNRFKQFNNINNFEYNKIKSEELSFYQTLLEIQSDLNMTITKEDIENQYNTFNNLTGNKRKMYYQLNKEEREIALTNILYNLQNTGGNNGNINSDIDGGIY